MKFRSAIIAILTLLSLTICVSTNDPPRRVWAYSVYSSHTNSKKRVRFLEKHIVESGDRLIVVYANENSDIQIQHIENFVSQRKKISGIFVDLADTALFEHVRRITHEEIHEEVPTVFFEKIAPTMVNEKKDDFSTVENTDAPNMSNVSDAPNMHKIAEIRSFSKDSGTLQAQFVVSKLKQKNGGNIALLTSSTESAHEVARLREIETVVSREPSIRITQQKFARSRRVEAALIVEQWIDNKEKFDAIIASNDKMALGASLALRERNLENMVIVVGSGGSEEAFEAIRSSHLAMTLSADSAQMAQLGIRMMHSLVENKMYNVIIDVAPIVVTKENLRSFYQP